MPTWNTASDWDSATAEDGVVHESVADTDHNDDTVIKKGYSIESPPYSSNLIGYWPLQEDFGDANDFSGNGNSGVVYGATQGVSGLLGTSAYAFDGVDDYIDLGSVYSFSDDSPFSYTAWINPNDNGNRRTIVGTGARRRDLQIDGSDRLHLEGYDGSDQDTIGSTVSNNTWSQVGVTYDGSTAELYIDGSKDTSGSFSYIESGGDFIGVANKGNGAKNWFDGEIAEVRIYNTDVSESTISSLYDVVENNGSLTTDYRPG